MRSEMPAAKDGAEGEDFMDENPVAMCFCPIHIFSTKKLSAG